MMKNLEFCYYVFNNTTDDLQNSKLNILIDENYIKEFRIRNADYMKKIENIIINTESLKNNRYIENSIYHISGIQKYWKA
jgi:Zn-finger domain-containing protein